MIITYWNHLDFLKRVKGAALFLILLICGLHVADLEAKASDADEIARRAKLFELYQRQIPLLEQFIAKYPQSDRAPETMFRLGEAYFESAKYFQATAAQTRAEVSNRKAIETLEALRRRYTNYERIDEVLYVLSAAYIESGNTNQAGPILSELARRFPNAPILVTAASILGDYYFDQDQLSEAKMFYQKAQSNPQRISYAHYKLAWIAIKELQPALALKHFTESLKANADQQSGFDYSREIAREIIWPALEVYGAQGILSYLDQTLRAEELHQLALSTLADGLKSRGENRLASQIYEHLTSRHVSSPKSSEWLTQYLENEEKLGRADKIPELVSRLSGAAMNSPAVQAKLFSSARKAHAMAQAESNSSEKSKLYDQAIAYYQSFLQVEPNAEKKAEMEFYFGEALFARNRFQEALRSYQSSAQTKHEKQGAAAWNWYLTAERIAPGFRFQEKHEGTLTVQDEMFLQAARFVSQFEDIELSKRRKASYQAARLLYQLNRFDESLPIFQQLAEFHPDSSEGQMSAELVLDIYNLRQDYSKVAQYAQTYKARANSAKRSDLGLLEEQSIFKLIQQEEKQLGVLQGAEKLAAQKSIASRYQDFSKNYSNSKLADAALWAAIQIQASVAYQEADQNFRDLRSNFNSLTSKYASSPFVKNAIDLMGDFLAEQNLDGEALKEFSGYKNQWSARMLTQPIESRGSLGWLVYELSSDTEKRQLEREFAKLPNTKENRKALAQGRFQDLKILAQKLSLIKLNDLKTMTAKTKEKLAALERLETEVTSVVAIGEPRVAIESLYLLGDANKEMAEAMRQAPVPSNLDASAKDQYRNFVEQKASSFELKANEARSLADKTSRELGV